MEIYKKYPSIENSYQGKFINFFTTKHPELMNEEFVIYEKLHGSNISLVFMNGEFNICSRNRVIPLTENFNQCWYVVKKYEDFIEYYKTLSSTNDNKYTFFGEIAGEGIQKGVEYGEKDIYLFDMMINDVLLSQQIFLSCLESFWNENLIVPSLCPIVENNIDFETALTYKNEFDSLILNKEDNVCEGIVIKPLNNVYRMNDSIFMLKSKNDTFSEKSSAKKNPKQIGKTMDENTFLLKIEFERYLNENRVNNMFSKEGVIQTPKEIGKYIQLIMQDAKEDFIKDHDVTRLDPKELKFIYGNTKIIVDILKKHL